MERTRTLLICFLLQSFTHGKDLSDLKNIEFSPGVQVFVRGTAHPVKPIVQILLPTEVRSDPASLVTLACVATRLVSRPQGVTWWVEGTPVPHKHTRHRVAKQTDGTFSAVGVHFVAAPDWDPEKTFRCEVRHNGWTHHVEVRPSACFQSDTAPATV